MDINNERAIKIWRSSKPADGSLVETYLYERAIGIPIPPTLRFHSNLKHTPTGLVLPALVAAVQAPDGLRSEVERILRNNPAMPWDQAVRDLARPDIAESDGGFQ